MPTWAMSRIGRSGNTRSSRTVVIGEDRASLVAGRVRGREDALLDVTDDGVRSAVLRELLPKGLPPQFHLVRRVRGCARDVDMG